MSFDEKLKSMTGANVTSADVSRKPFGTDILENLYRLKGMAEELSISAEDLANEIQPTIKEPKQLSDKQTEPEGFIYQAYSLMSDIEEKMRKTHDQVNAIREMS